MPWLVVLGEGSWNPRGYRFRAGKHEVSEEVAQMARSAGLSMLMVLDEEPEILKGVGPGPLTPEDIKVGTTAGVRLPQPTLEEELEAEYEIPRAYPCNWCVEHKAFPSQAALDRHQKRKHPEFAAR